MKKELGSFQSRGIGIGIGYVQLLELPCTYLHWATTVNWHKNQIVHKNVYFPLASKDLPQHNFFPCSSTLIDKVQRLFTVGQERWYCKRKEVRRTTGGGSPVCNWAALRCPELVSPSTVCDCVLCVPKWRTPPLLAAPQLRQQFNQFIAVPANPWLKAFANILFYSCLLLYSLFLRLSCLFVDPLGFMFIVDIGTKLVLLLVDFLLYWLCRLYRKLKAMFPVQPNRSPQMPVRQYFSFL